MNRTVSTGGHADPSTLANIGMFAGVPKRDLRYVAEQFRVEWFKRGETIVREGDPGARLFVLTEGEARVVSAEGRTRKRLGKGSIIGELSIIDPAPRNFTVEAVSDVSAVSVSSTAFLALLQDQPMIARAVMRILVRRLRDVEAATWAH